MRLTDDWINHMIRSGQDPFRIPKRAQELADRLGVDDLWNKNVIKCGLHSGIPECCVAFYVLAWEDLYAMPEYAKAMDKVRHLGRHRAANNYRLIGYVPCPACLLAETFVKVRRCKCGEIGTGKKR